MLMNPSQLSKKRFNAALIAPLLLLALSGPVVTAEKLEQSGFSLALPRSADPIIINSAGVRIVNLFSSPQIEGVSATAPWSHLERSERERVLGGRPGALTTDRFQTDGLELWRETWISHDRRQTAFRHRLVNRGGRPFRLTALHPFDCQFDGIVIPPGGDRSSQWLLLSVGDRARELIDGFADAVGQFHGVKQPRQRPPSVFCTWYYHGFHYNEDYFHEDLEPWVTVSFVNWTDAEKAGSLRLDEEVVGSLNSREYLVFDFWKQEILGAPGDA